MDLNFYDNDFEEFLKQKSDQYKMYPSDRVWNNVYSSLHGRKKWWALGFALFFIGTGLLTGRHVLLSDYNRIATQLNKENTSLLLNAPPVKNRETANSLHLPFTSTINQNGNRHELSPVQDAAINRMGNTPVTSNQSSVATTSATDNSTLGSIETGQVIVNRSSEGQINTGSEQPQTVAQSLPIPSIKALATSKQAERSKLKTNMQSTASVRRANELTAALAPGKWSLQVYASPTISYRRLSNYDQQGTNHVPVAASYAADVNRYVNHRPAPGFELGANVQYKLSDNLSVFAGAQLNYSRYYINAFKYSREKTSIELEKAFVRDTLSGYTDIRNFSGYAPEQLQNKYLQLSVPVGIEIKLLGHRKLQFSVAGSVQPTFLLTSTSYLLSSDYKNYIQSPDLARTFNVHTNFEAFVSYQAAGLKWQIGPQFRSQLLSSYSNQYRVREYLTEYGIKIGVSKTLR